VAPTTVALAVLLASLPTAAGGAWLVQRALALPAPDRTRPPEVPGVVTFVAAMGCGTRSRPAQCYRPTATYRQGGEERRVASRALYRSSSPLRQGEPVPVLVEADGTAWLAFEWERQLADRVRDHAQARRLPLVMGGLLVACGAFGILLAVAAARATPADTAAS
jgi:hypothetical protein